MRKNIMLRFLTVFLIGVLLIGCGNTGQDNTAGSDSTGNTESVHEQETDQEEEEQTVTIRVGGMLGPTAMGMVKLMEDSANGETENIYEFADLAADASAFVTPLATGKIDIAAVPSNLASVLYHNTDGAVEVLAVNTFGVLNIVERGENISTLEDLKGKTLYATGQGATPEYTLRYLLKENGVDPDSDLTIQWCTDTTELLSYVSKKEGAIAMVPQPFATAALTQVSDLRIVMDLNEEWAKLDIGCEIVTGVMVVRREFAEAYPQQLAKFMEEYEASVRYTEEDVDTTAALIEKYIGVKAAVAAKALPGCHITFLKGKEMRTALEGYLQIIYNENSASVGGSMPGDDFYYGS